MSLKNLLSRKNRDILRMLRISAFLTSLGLWVLSAALFLCVHFRDNQKSKTFILPAGDSLKILFDLVQELRQFLAGSCFLDQVYIVAASHYFPSFLPCHHQHREGGSGGRSRWTVSAVLSGFRYPVHHLICFIRFIESHKIIIPVFMVSVHGY